MTAMSTSRPTTNKLATNRLAAIGRHTADGPPALAAPDRLGLAVDGDDPTAFDRYQAFYALGSDVAALGDGFRAELDCVRLDRMVVHRRRLRGVAHGRDAGCVRRSALEHFTVTLCLEGTMFGAGAQGFRRIRPGEAWVTDMTQPVQTRIEDARLLTLAVGREVVEAATQAPAQLHATVLPAARTAPVARALRRLVESTDALSPDEAAIAAQETTRLVTQMLGPPTPSGADRLARLAQARRIIDAHLDRPDLDAIAIADELGLSRSTIYRLFAPMGGVARVVQARRLERMHRLLSERTIGTSIAELAAAVGFASESHASRRFLARYGRRPGAFRAETRGPSELGADMVRMSGWLADLQ